MSDKIIESKLVIIGAGISGLSAAVKLLDNGVGDFLIFEALERIGGRICTEKSDDGYLEIGAQWIHGQKNNPIFEIARENNLLLEGFDQIIEGADDHVVKLSAPPSELYQDLNVSTDAEKVLFVSQHGKKLTSAFAQTVYDTVSKIFHQAAALSFGPESGVVDDRVGDYVYDTFVERVRAELGETSLSSVETRRVLDAIFLMRAKRENIHSGFANIFDLSLRNFSAYKEFAGHPFVELKHGYAPVLNKIIDKHVLAINERTRLRHHLKQIIFSDDSSLYERTSSWHDAHAVDKSKIVLHMCDASDPNDARDFYVVCERVLCTMSLGYLKENVNHVIRPLQLIESKRAAIARLGFGTVNKIFLKYDKKFWNDSLELINFIWVPSGAQFHLDKLNHRNIQKRHWNENICKMEVVKSQANTLSAWIAGCEQFEMLDESAIALECTKLLRTFLGDESIPLPSSIKRSKWNSNVFSRGSYSCLPLGTSVDDIKCLATPIPSQDNPRVLFAGEATHTEYFSTVHGAYMSGIREATRLLDILKS